MLKIGSMGITPGVTNGSKDFRLYVNNTHIGTFSSENDATQHYLKLKERQKTIQHVMAHFAKQYADEVKNGLQMSAGTYMDTYIDEISDDSEKDFVVELINKLIEP
jgi:hypothetical protein